MSHVVPELILKVLKGQDPLHILGGGNQLRCYTYGGDLAKGILATLLHPATLQEDFNLSTSTATSVLELAELIWRCIRGPEVPFRYVSDEAYPCDVQRRIPSTDKAQSVLGFRASTSLQTALDEVIPWVQGELRNGRL
jgi:nucleoside-diphosphate-sugar epimerase